MFIEHIQNSHLFFNCLKHFHKLVCGSFVPSFTSHLTFSFTHSLTHSPHPFLLLLSICAPLSLHNIHRHWQVSSFLEFSIRGFLDLVQLAGNRENEVCLCVMVYQCVCWTAVNVMGYHMVMLHSISCQLLFSFSCQVRGVSISTQKHRHIKAQYLLIS